MAYEVYYKTTITTKKKWFNRFILVLGIIGGIFAIVKSIKELSEWLFKYIFTNTFVKSN